MNLIRKTLTRLKRADWNFTKSRTCAAKQGTNSEELHVYNAMFKIPLEFGGMVNSMLRRINGFVQYGSHPSMTILTFDGNSNPEATRERLVQQGRLEESVTIRNTWTDLRTMSDDDLHQFISYCQENTKVITAIDKLKQYESPMTFFEGDQDGDKHSYERYCRQDGTLIGLQLFNETASTRTVLYSSAEMPIAEFRTIESLYNEWVRSLTRNKRSLLIVDDKAVSEFICEIGDRDFNMILFMHGSHLRRPYDGPYGESLANRTNTMRNIERFDFVATQTRQQAVAIAAKGIAPSKLKHLPSELSFSPDPAASYSPRDDLSGAIVARLSKLKRVDHAISAIAQSNELGTKAHLTAFGKGPEMENLRNYSRELEIDDRIEFAGHVADLPAQLESRSFSLLTSTSEGLGLAIIESMAVGCVPITYDINYGPRDVIDSGVDGYVVPFGDTSALAAAITEFLGLDTGAKLQMRIAAIEKSMSYLPSASYARWAAAISGLSTANDSLSPPGAPPTVVDDIFVSPQADSVDLAISFVGSEKSSARSLQLLFASRSKNTFFQMTSSITPSLGGFGFSIPYDCFSQSKGQKFDIFVRFVGDTWESKRRLKLPDGFEVVDSGRLRWFRTKYGNASVKVMSLDY